MTRIYLDHNATTPPSAEVLAAQATAAAQCWGNPSSRHAEGRAARQVVEQARQQVAALLGARPDEIVFTSGGTEANNTAVLLGAAVITGPRRGAITSPLEHPSVGAACKELVRAGVPVAYLPVDGRGRIDPADLERALLQHPTRLVSLSLCNHEIGNLYDIPILCRLAHAHGALFHCDAVQAVGRVPVDVAALEVDLLSLSAHKLHGPRGIGALYVRRQSRGAMQGTALVVGGGQERGLRAGTEATPAIAGLGAACRLAQAGLKERRRRVAALRDRLEAALLRIPGAAVRGDAAPSGRGPGTCNIGFAGVEGDLLMMNLDLRGVAVSTGAACSSGSLEPSPVLLALGLEPAAALQGVRFSLGAENTEAEVDLVAGLVAEIVAHVRAVT